MKQIKTLLIATLFLLGGSQTSNAQAKTAHVDVTDIMSKMPAMLDAQKQLEKISATYDADYKKMRALCPSTKGLREKYEQAIVDKHHAAFMEHLKTMGPYYRAKEWENDYSKQLRNQKFMRQVNYKRPKGTHSLAHSLTHSLTHSLRVCRHIRSTKRDQSR